jgi:hypothetical protein
MADSYMFLLLIYAASAHHTTLPSLALHLRLVGQDGPLPHLRHPPFLLEIFWPQQGPGPGMLRA